MGQQPSFPCCILGAAELGVEGVVGKGLTMAAVPGQWEVTDGDAQIIALCASAAAGRAEAVKRLLDDGVKPTALDYDRRSALHIAAARGHFAVVELLVGARAEVNTESRRGHTPLDEAMHSGTPEVRQLLLDARAVYGDEA